MGDIKLFHLRIHLNVLAGYYSKPCNILSVKRFRSNYYSQIYRLFYASELLLRLFQYFGCSFSFFNKTLLHGYQCPLLLLIQLFCQLVVI